MDSILDGVMRFQQVDYPREREYFEHLAQKPQRPKALFITCSDSRVMPNHITKTEPGELFTIRNAGNLVPPYSEVMAGGEIATIEYSVAVLGIKHLIICGHSCCGAMEAMLHPEKMEDLHAVQSWLSHAEATRQIMKLKHRELSGDERLMVAVEENVLVQMNNLSTHPCVAARIATGEVRIYGWYYDIAQGKVLQYHPGTRKFEVLGGEAHSSIPLPLRYSDDPILERDPTARD
jgi:carbonic anhydrase